MNLATNYVCQYITKMKNMFSWYKKMFLPTVGFTEQKKCLRKIPNMIQVHV